VAAVDRMTEGKMDEKYEIFNIGTGRPVSVLELITEFEKVNNLKLPYKMVDRRPGDVPAVWAETSRANEILGWKAERTIDQTLKAAWEWEKHVRNLK
jgi:UDP-glucose 4-epimerase